MNVCPPHVNIMALVIRATLALSLAIVRITGLELLVVIGRFSVKMTLVKTELVITCSTITFASEVCFNGSLVNDIF